ncbi:hypothetical protein NPIL_91751 [Nephila pilipes]|uniref:Uncharacterized protein n=1 Tax=Nephila pilipes TaxID=299642 RepID=A0A8X6NWK0_NEPPI|nr:hypothetical protein NPIL_91751 [Nephila pilipes]
MSFTDFKKHLVTKTIHPALSFSPLNGSPGFSFALLIENITEADATCSNSPRTRKFLIRVSFGNGNGRSPDIFLPFLRKITRRSEESRFSINAPGFLFTSTQCVIRIQKFLHAPSVLGCLLGNIFYKGK